MSYNPSNEGGNRAFKTMIGYKDKKRIEETKRRRSEPRNKVKDSKITKTKQGKLIK